jgi:hypothetical protein
MISKEDRNRLRELFGNMTIEQIMTYVTYFSPAPVSRKSAVTKVRSSDGKSIDIWGDSVQEMCDDLVRYQKTVTIF